VRTPHLISAAAVLLLVTAVLTGGTLYARWVEGRYIHALAPQMFEQKNQGSALQRAAFRQPDLLPVYGSSELPISTPYHASALFRDYPTGFTIFPVGKPATTSLIWLQELAAVGPDLRGKKVVLSLSPSTFFVHDMIDPESYAGNFSLLHASELAFSSQLSFAVKEGAARRMLDYPATLQQAPLLKFALEKLADGSALNRIFYYAVLPLGKLQIVVLRLKDHWETLAFLRRQDGLRSRVPRQGARLDWPQLLERARRESEQLADNNPFGFDRSFWLTRADEIAKQKGIHTDQEFLRSLERCSEWADLNLLLHGLKDLGARVLILSMPIKGAYHDYVGISAQARRAYYGKLHQLAKRTGAPVMDFADHDGDCYFLTNWSFHLSREGWLYYDRALDAFFHDRPVETEILEMSAAEQRGS